MKNRRTIIFLVITFLILVACQKSKIYLTSGNHSDYAIFCAKKESIIVQHAAQELADYLQKISGVHFSIVTKENGNQKLIVVGRKNSFVKNIKQPKEAALIQNDGFIIFPYQDTIFIYGIIDRGTMYGVYYFLDHYLGVKWLSSDFTVIPKKNEIILPRKVDLQNPHFIYREIFSGDTDDPYFRAHNRLNGNRWGTHRAQLLYPKEVDNWCEYGPAGGHNFQDIVSRVYHFGGQIKAMEEEVREIAANYFKKLIQREGAKRWYAFSQEDNGWQPDPKSAEFAKQHGGALSAPIVDLVIDVARRVRKEIPDAHLSTDAYQWSFMPPKGMTVPEYVMIEIAPIEENFGFPYNNRTHNNKAAQAFNGWNQIAATLGVWDYITNFQNYLQPWPNIYPMCENIQYFAQLPSIKSYFGQGSYNTQGAEFANLRAWIAARLLWNPQQDYRKLIAEFCDAYYGPASPYVKEYIHLLHRSFLNSDGFIGAKQPITSSYLNLDFILKADSLMILADSVAQGDYAKHVHNVRIGVDMTILLQQHFFEKQAEKKGKVWNKDSKRFTRFKRYVQEANITNYSEDQSIEALFNALKIQRVYPPKPDFISPQKHWLDFQEMDFQICCGASIVQDEKASDHGAVKYRGKEWAIQMKLDMLPPKGKWILYAAVRVELAPHATKDDIAFNMGIFPGKEKSVKVLEVKEKQYRFYRFPGNAVSYQTGKDAWFTTGKGTKNIFIDRIIAVEEDNSLGENK